MSLFPKKWSIPLTRVARTRHSMKGTHVKY